MFASSEQNNDVRLHPKTNCIKVTFYFDSLQLLAASDINPLIFYYYIKVYININKATVNYFCLVLKAQFGGLSN